jgi:hypothetical protein
MNKKSGKLCNKTTRAPFKRVSFRIHFHPRETLHSEKESKVLNENDVHKTLHVRAIAAHQHQSTSSSSSDGLQRMKFMCIKGARQTLIHLQRGT